MARHTCLIHDLCWECTQVLHEAENQNRQYCRVGKRFRLGQNCRAVVRKILNAKLSNCLSLMQTESKTCARCRKTKALNDFPKMSRSKDGLHPWCKCCRCAYEKRYQDNHNKARKEKYANDPKYRQKVSERHKKHNSKARKRAANNSTQFSDTYVIAAIKRGTDLTTADIRPYPALIDAQRQNMKLTRILKQKRNEHRNITQETGGTI